MNIEKSERLFKLFKVYGELLTSKQKNVLNMFLNFDNTLVEIAEELGITRQGVYNIVSDSTKLLSNFEEKLHFVQNFEEVKQSLQQLNSSLEKEGCVSKAQQKLLQDIIDKI